MNRGFSARFRVDGIENRVSGGATLELTYVAEPTIPANQRWAMPDAGGETFEIDLPPGADLANIEEGSFCELTLTPVTAGTHAEAAVAGGTKQGSVR
jgi:hypothetical protein